MSSAEAIATPASPVASTRSSSEFAPFSRSWSACSLAVVRSGVSSTVRTSQRPSPWLRGAANRTASDCWADAV